MMVFPDFMKYFILYLISSDTHFLNFDFQIAFVIYCIQGQTEVFRHWKLQFTNVFPMGTCTCKL